MKKEMLRFLGRGSDLSDEQNCAFFTQENELVLIGCGVTAFHKLRRLGLTTLAGTSDADVTVLVTHTHSAHIGGIPMLIHYMYCMLHKKVTVIAPSAEVADDLRLLIGRLNGCEDDAYDIITADRAGRNWLVHSIPTAHSPELEGRCFGYHLLINGEKVIYTGDTAVIDPFLPYLTTGCFLYSDAAASPTTIHIKAEELIRKTVGHGIRLYLMHTDDEETLSAYIKEPYIRFAPLFEDKQ